MAFITKTNDTKCYSCGKQCVNVDFCSAGGSYHNDDIGTQGISLSRNIRVSITANPQFWGFSGVLISGWATYTNGYYDFFDGYDEDYQASKSCTSDGTTTTYGPFFNEQRPDVLYRSVYDPDTKIVKHYGSDGLLEGSGAGRGGAEAYLIDRRAGLISSVTSDLSSCATSNPTQIFKQFPENFGWANKINFNSKVYKNLSAAWRLISLENCHQSSNIYKPAGYLIDCSGNEKQNIRYKINRFQNYEPSRPRASGSSSYYDYVSGCYPDGAAAGKYAGYFTYIDSFYRSTASSSFIQAKLSYGSLDSPVAASGLKNGMTIGIKSDVSGNINNVYTIFDVTHYTTFTSVKFVGTSSNNTQINGIPTGDFSINISKSGHWVAFNTYDSQTCCGLSAYGVSDTDKALSSSANYHTDFRRIFNNPKNTLQSNRDRQWRYNYNLFNTINSVSGLSSSGRLDYTYPSVSGTGLALMYGNLISGYPVFEKQLSYYGNFFNTDLYDSFKRFDQVINRGKSRNGTCYSKYASLEIFPDCITQYDKYSKCVTEADTYMTNRIPRLAFVYRGCDFNDDCSFNSSGLPLGGWKNQNNVPTGISDLKRQLAGQEVHMFINLGNAWGRKSLNPCRCDCAGVTPGQNAPEHVEIPSPLTFPSFPNFDLNPTGYGCKDPRYQINYKRREIGGYISASGACDPLPTSNYACLPKQPYVTYGYIMNLCGKESTDRKSVITEAFSKLHQDKTYTNVNPTGSVIEPMYWNITAPKPQPFGGAVWSSGSSSLYDGGGSFIQASGSGYGFWGLADSNKQVVAPYFCTQKSTFTCCTNSGSYLDFSTTGTLSNTLNTSNGWPTSAVPFLIEIEVDDACVGCVSPSMKKAPLNLQIDGLDSEFIWQQLGTRYGHNYCKYGTAGLFGKAKTEPSFTCSSGFNLSACGGADSLKATYGNYYTGNTCSCVSGLNVTLYPVSVSGANNVIIGWTSNQAGGAAGLVEISGCNDYASSYIDADYLRAEGAGYRIFAQFDLACQDLHGYLMKPFYPDVYYEGNPIGSIWANSSKCSHHYPARVGENADLDLQTTLYLVGEQNVPIFKKLTDRGLKYKNFSECITLSDFSTSPNIFGICPGESVYTYGCKLTNTSGVSYFYGCTSPNGYGPGAYLECTGATLCNTCPTGISTGEVTCYCGNAIGYEGIFPRRVPANYQMNECSCKCKDPSLIAKYTLTSTGLVLVSGASAACASVYWVGTDSIAPILINCPTPQPFIGIKLGKKTSTDWYDWSHGVNSVVSGINYELNYPFLNTQECNTLRRYPYTAGKIANNIDCTLKSGDANYCNANSVTNTKTCGNPIYSSGTIGNSIKVRKKKCHPEVAIVTKIDCLGDTYKLYISREYHEHDRTWNETINVGGTNVCSPVNAGAYVYNYASGVSGCQQINYASLADTVTPAYNPPCSVNPSSGLYVSQDYQYLNFSTLGSKIWNYFNLFYSSTFLPSVGTGYLIPSMSRTSGVFSCSGTPLTIRNTGVVFSTSGYNSPSGFNGIFATNKKHSCVQDSAVCGGDLWCNKLFFPRHTYKTGTRIAPFGAPSICTTNNEFKYAFNLDGYIEDGQLLSAGKDLLDEQKMKFFDWCNDDLVQTSVGDIDIDSTEVIVSNYLPLIGVIHSGWKFTADTKSCTVGGTGCQDKIPIHTDGTIAMGLHQPKTFTSNGFESMGYYLDKYGVSYGGKASGVNQCLFNPFKILIDVECSLNRIARTGFPSDPPTYLHGVQEWPAESCLGMVGSPGCTCSSTKCDFVTNVKKGDCTAFIGTSYQGTLVTGKYWYCPSGTECSGCGLKNCTEVNGTYIQVGSPVGKFFDASLLQSVSPMGEISNTPVVCYCQSGSGTTSGVYQVATPTVGSWVSNTCDGSVYMLLENGTRYVRKWNCNSNQYINKAPSLGYMTSCECESDLNNGLCDAQFRCSDFSTCGCNPVGTSGQLTPSVTTLSTGGSGTWWSTDCGCDAYPVSAGACTQNSLVQWQITEA